MRNAWWKYLAIAILLYAIVGGMLVPLGPGIENSEPLQSKMGENLKLEVETYNFNNCENLAAWLRMDSFLLKANKISQIGPSCSQLEVDFSLPDHFPHKDQQREVSLILFHPDQGSAVLPTALFLKQSEINYSQGVKSWESDSIFEGMNLVGSFHFPYRNILVETLRNTYFHVPMWFAMIALFTLSFIASIMYLRNEKFSQDTWVVNLNRVGVLFGILGLITGAIWANYTWGEPWSGDVKQNMSAICLLIYAAFFVLRATIDDNDKKRRISAVFNIFAYIAMIPLLFVIPRMTDSLHPGSGGNPAMGGEDLDNTMRMFFYPAIIGWILLGIWISEIGKRYDMVRIKLLKKLNG